MWLILLSIQNTGNPNLVFLQPFSMVVVRALELQELIAPGPVPYSVSRGIPPLQKCNISSNWICDWKSKLSFGMEK